MWEYMVCVIVKATKYHASLESLGQRIFQAKNSAYP